MKCKVCGKHLKIKKTLRYTVTKKPVGLNCLTQGTTIYECFDCDKCGCQNIVNIREENDNEVSD